MKGGYRERIRGSREVKKKGNRRIPAVLRGNIGGIRRKRSFQSSSGKRKFSNNLRVRKKKTS